MEVRASMLGATCAPVVLIAAIVRFVFDVSHTRVQHI